MRLFVCRAPDVANIAPLADGLKSLTEGKADSLTQGRGEKNIHATNSLLVDMTSFMRGQ